MQAAWTNPRSRPKQHKLAWLDLRERPAPGKLTAVPEKVELNPDQVKLCMLNERHTRERNQLGDKGMWGDYVGRLSPRGSLRKLPVAAQHLGAVGDKASKLVDRRY